MDSSTASPLPLASAGDHPITSLDQVPDDMWRLYAAMCFVMDTIRPASREALNAFLEPYIDVAKRMLREHPADCPHCKIYAKTVVETPPEQPNDDSVGGDGSEAR